MSEYKKLKYRPGYRGYEFRKKAKKKFMERRQEISSHTYVDSFWIKDGYVKMAKNSKRHQFYKKQASKRTRHCEDVPAIGSGYKRVYPYWDIIL